MSGGGKLLERILCLSTSFLVEDPIFQPGLAVSDGFYLGSYVPGPGANMFEVLFYSRRIASVLP